MENVIHDMQYGSSAVAIVGEAVAGIAAQTLAEVKKLVKGLSVNTFDLAEKLHAIKKGKFYAPKYNTFGEYSKSLDLKLSKCYYLAKIVEMAEACGIERAQYEPVGIAKLRIISRLDLVDADGQPKMYDGVPATTLIPSILGIAESTSPDAIEATVRKLKGQVGDNAPVWYNISMTEGQRAKWEEAVSLAKKHIGSVSKDADGNYKDASEGHCAEEIAVNYILDPNNYPEGYHETKDDLPV